MKNTIKVSFHWIDDECASIICPYCKRDLIVDISEKSKCDCGKEFILQQQTWVEEIKEE
jgi:hypothetical protein